MRHDEMIEVTNEQLEILAAAQHEIWAHWMKYLFSKCDVEIDLNGVVLSCSIPPELANRWCRQAWTDYSDLTEKEKQSDRDQVLKFSKGINQERMQ